MPQPTPRGASRGKTARRSGACGATATTPGRSWPSAARPGPRATTAAATRERSAGGEAAAGLERCERAHPLRGRHTFFERLHGEGSCSHDRQQGQRPHGEGHLSRPPRPAPHVIMLEPHLTLRGVEAAFNGPTGPRHPHDLGPRGLLPRKDDIERLAKPCGRTPARCSTGGIGSAMAPHAREFCQL